MIWLGLILDFCLAGRVAQFNSHSICLSPTGPSGFCYGENVRILQPTHSHCHNKDLLWLCSESAFHLTLFSWSWRWFSHSEPPPPETSHFQPDSKNIFGKTSGNTGVLKHNFMTEKQTCKQCLTTFQESKHFIKEHLNNLSATKIGMLVQKIFTDLKDHS